MRPDGQTVRWRMAGLDDPRREPWMPFFLIWDISDELHPRRARVERRRTCNRSGVGRCGRKRGRLHRLRLGGDELPIRVTDDEPGVHRVAISTADGELVIGY